MNTAQKYERSIATKKQVRALSTLASKIYNSDEAFKYMLLNNYGVESRKQLTGAQAGELITRFSAMVGGKHKPGSSERNKIKKHIFGKGQRGHQRHLTPLQAERINILSDLMYWDEYRLMGMLKRQTSKATAVSFLMNYEAVKVIIGMQRIYANGDRDLNLKINAMTNAELIGLPKKSINRENKYA